MSLTLALVHLFLNTAQAAPLSPLTLRKVNNSLNPTGDTICPDQQRSLWDILLSCSATIFACTWVSVHPNVPAPEDTEWKIVRRRIALMFVALVAPELVILWAMREWNAARIMMKRFKFEGWTKTHAYFIHMGGFMWYNQHRRRPWEVLHFDDLERYIEEGKIKLPTISEKDIQDRSKSDTLTKAIALGQTTWFFIQTIARHAQGLAVTELELVTAALAVLNAIIYFLWWNKPLDVRHANRVQLQFSLEGEESRPGQEPTLISSFPYLLLASISLNFDVQMDKTPHGKSETPPLSGGFLRECGKLFFPIEVSGANTRVPSFWVADNEMRDFAIAQILISSLIAIGFGGIHCLGWAFTFPSYPELLLWRVCSCVIAATPAVMALCSMLLFLHSQNRIRLRESLEISVSTIIPILLLTYFAGRIILLIEALVALRNLRESAFRVVRWTTFIPHV
ncbi:hypothetical protein GALMADRAFT_81262 [Galerina marginata CBS 339.88]|uniref:Uncharacterized protein n=1 Tax=Galerina marginata (strain CBS 339.88) TaxID=685588 RepID=A0A067SEE0_GALM3|nr:hypothetical protein GALMADRAFT_81262 [Galerina marginata CBS 339.88]